MTLTTPSTCGHGGSNREHPLAVDRVVLVGNPNVGKSVLFGALTGNYVTVSNYPGTTVEVTSGGATIAGRRVEVLDTPGANNLVPVSEDERVTRDILLHHRHTVVVQVADAKNLRRALLITIQLAEMGVPMVLALNMHDEATDRGIQVDAAQLARLLGVEVVPTVAIRRRGVERLRQAIARAQPATYRVTYDPPLEDAAERIAAMIPDCPVSPKAAALMALASDGPLDGWFSEHLSPDAQAELHRCRLELQARYPQPVAYVINGQRMRAADALASSVERHSNQTPRNIAALTATFGRLAMHPLWGIPVLLAVLFLVFEFVGVFGAQTVVGFMEETVFGRYVNPTATHIVNVLVPLPLLRDLLVGQYGVITMALTYGMAIVLPIVATFFLAFGVLEDSGYLPRLAVMVNRLFRTMGLNGKAVLPMVLGLGCDTMATLTTRILESKKERLLVTLLLTLGVPCSAQLAVILGMLRALSFTGTLIWAGMVVGSLLVVGYAAARVLPGDTSEFVMELPPIRRPQLSNLAVKVMARMEWYLKEALPLFILGTLILFVADKLHLLGMVERAFRPVVVTLLGLPPQAAMSFIMGFLRRDYGATLLYHMAQHGQLDHVQILVSLVTITFFVPCIAQVMVTVKERGLKPAMATAAVAMLFAIAAGAALNVVVRATGVPL